LKKLWRYLYEKKANEREFADISNKPGQNNKRTLSVNMDTYRALSCPVMQRYVAEQREPILKANSDIGCIWFN
jgi:hypothetical protein